MGQKTVFMGDLRGKAALAMVAGMAVTGQPAPEQRARAPRPRQQRRPVTRADLDPKLPKPGDSRQVRRRLERKGW